MIDYELSVSKGVGVEEEFWVGWVELRGGRGDEGSVGSSSSAVVRFDSWRGRRYGTVTMA